MMNRRCSIWSRFPNRAPCAPRRVGPSGTTPSAIRRACPSSPCTACPRAARGTRWADARARARADSAPARTGPAGVGESDTWRLGRTPTVADYAAQLDAFRGRTLALVVFTVGLFRWRPVRVGGRARAGGSRDRGRDRFGGVGQVGEWATIDEFETSDRVLTRDLAPHVPRLCGRRSHSRRTAPASHRRRRRGWRRRR